MVIDWGVFGPCDETAELQGTGVGGLKLLPGVAGLPMDIGDAIAGDAIAVSTDFIRLGGGPPEAHALCSGSSCLTSCLTDTGIHDAFESIVTSSTSVFVSVVIIWKRYSSISSPSNNAFLLQTGHFQFPFSTFNFR